MMRDHLMAAGYEVLEAAGRRGGARAHPRHRPRRRPPGPRHAATRRPVRARRDAGRRGHGRDPGRVRHRARDRQRTGRGPRSRRPRLRPQARRGGASSSPACARHCAPAGCATSCASATCSSSAWPAPTCSRAWSSRRHGPTMLAEACTAAAAAGESLAVSMADIDHFKHDQRPPRPRRRRRRAARRRRRHARRHRDRRDGRALGWRGVPARAARLRRGRCPGAAPSACASRWPPRRVDAGGRRHGVTASLGCAILGSGETPEALVARADQALYAAKAGGRDRVAAVARVRARARLQLASARSCLTARVRPARSAPPSPAIVRARSARRAHARPGAPRRSARPRPRPARRATPPSARCGEVAPRAPEVVAQRLQRPALHPRAHRQRVELLLDPARSARGPPAATKVTPDVLDACARRTPRRR